MEKTTGSFAPTINMNGETITPKGYEWILGFALHGCDWAIKKAMNPEFISLIRSDLKQETIKSLEIQIKRYENKISEIKTEIDSYT